jgi:hypothetical protein
MSFINFFRKKKQKLKKPIDFDEIKILTGDKRKEIKEKEKEIFILIKNKIPEFLENLNEKLEVLENVDINSKKVENKIKLIVKENLINYLRYVKTFMEKMENLDEKNFEKFIVNIKQNFLDFDKKSYIGYQKVTFLIGKEIAEVKNSIINFSKYLEKLFSINKEVMQNSKIIFSIELKLKDLEKVKEIINEIEEKIKLKDNRIKKFNDLNEKIIKKIEEIKKSKDHIENLKKQEKIKFDNKELEKEIYKLKEMINFKNLANIFHVSEKKMNFLKDYKENFLENFQKDNGVGILNLINETKMDKQEILNKLENINQKKETIKKFKETIKKDEVKELFIEMEKIKLGVENLINEKNKELKRYEKFKVSKEEIINLVKKEFSGMN